MSMIESLPAFYAAEADASESEPLILANVDDSSSLTLEAKFVAALRLGLKRKREATDLGEYYAQELEEEASESRCERTLSHVDESPSHALEVAFLTTLFGLKLKRKADANLAEYYAQQIEEEASESRCERTLLNDEPIRAVITPAASKKLLNTARSGSYDSTMTAFELEMEPTPIA